MSGSYGCLCVAVNGIDSVALVLCGNIKIVTLAANSAVFQLGNMDTLTVLEEGHDVFSIFRCLLFLVIIAKCDFVVRFNPFFGAFVVVVTTNPINDGI